MVKLLEDLGCHDKELSIVLTSDETIAVLNQNYLRRNGPTNVLAFPMQDEPQFSTPMLGDIVVSVDTALREAQEAGEDPLYTIDRLLVHGLLHLLGYDHENSEAEAAAMHREEQRLLELIREEESHGTVGS